MNIHVSDRVREKYPQMEFRGKQFVRYGRTMIESRNSVAEMTFFYSFDEDFFWFADSEPPKEKMKRFDFL